MVANQSAAEVMKADMATRQEEHMDTCSFKKNEQKQLEQHQFGNI